MDRINLLTVHPPALVISSFSLRHFFAAFSMCARGGCAVGYIGRSYLGSFNGRCFCTIILYTFRLKSTVVHLLDQTACSAGISKRYIVFWHVRAVCDVLGRFHLCCTVESFSGDRNRELLLVFAVLFGCIFGRGWLNSLGVPASASLPAEGRTPTWGRGRIITHNSSESGEGG